MSFRCENCYGFFFKILETRVSVANQFVFYKKRCKRCKFKYVVRKHATVQGVQVATHQEWTEARKVLSGKASVADRGKVFVSEYTSRISQAPEKTQVYLLQIQAAEKQGGVSP